MTELKFPARDPLTFASVRIRHMLFLGFLTIWVPLAAATTYYIDFATGSDGNDGITPTTPWRRCPGDTNAISRAAIASLGPGDILKFKGGVVYDGTVVLRWSGAANNSIVYDGNAAGDWGLGRAIIERHYLSYKNGGIGFLGTPGASFLSFKGFEFRNIGGFADDDPILQTTCPTNAFTFGADGYGFFFYDVNAGRNTNLRFENLYFHRIGQWRNTQPFSGNDSVSGGGIYLKNPSHVIVTNCEFSQMKVAVGLYSDTPDKLVDNVEIVDIKCHNHMQWPIDVAALADGARFQSIAIHNSRLYDYYETEYGNWLGCGDPPHTDGIFLRNAGRTNTYWTNVAIFNCDFYGNNIGSSHGGTASIYVSEGPSVDIYNNVFWNVPETRTIGVEHGHYSTQPQTVRIMNNTFYGPQKPVIMSGPPTQDQRRVYLWNNIFYVVTSGAGYTHLSVESGVLPVDLNYNLYWDPNFSVSQKYILKNLTSYLTFSSVQSQLRFDLNSKYIDPALNISPTYSPDALLPARAVFARGWGTNLYRFFTTDKAGNPRPAPGEGGWDVGAFQHTARPGPDHFRVETP